MMTISCRLIEFRSRGWIYVEGSRTCLTDIEHGFYGIRKSVEQLIGPVAGTVYYNAAIEGGIAYVRGALRSGSITESEQGFKDCVDAYAQLGFGDFIVEEIDYEHAKGVVTCKDAFEGWAWKKHGDTSKACYYSCGILTGFMRALTGREDIECVETECIAEGADACVFVIAPKKELVEQRLMV
ncbi:MAG: 4-vinyl reductase [Euryarchaeota archaeon]|nr:4-vinyl reductase [Euryarchaeota archaeon]